MASTPPPISPFTGLAPQRKDKSTFSDRFDAFITWFIACVASLPALALNVYNNALEAFQSAGTATSAAAAAMATANVVPWASGVTFQQYANVISPIDGFTYRRRTAAGSGTTDPSADPTNWGFPQPLGWTNMVVLRSTQAWTPPAGVTKAEISVINGGSGNGGSSYVSTYGRGGAASVSVRAVSSSVTYTATVGAAGTGGNPESGSLPTGGGASSFSGTGFTTLTAANGDLLIPGGQYGDSLHAKTAVWQTASTAPGQGGGAQSQTSGNNGATGAVIIRY